MNQHFLTTAFMPKAIDHLKTRQTTLAAENGLIVPAISKYSSVH
jgi:hypothetical protein